VYNIAPAIKQLKVVILAKAGIQKNTGCRIKSGMTALDYSVAMLIVIPYRAESGPGPLDMGIYDL